MRIASRALALILIAPAFVACKKTENKPTEAKPADSADAKPVAAAPVAAKPAGEAKPTEAAAAAPPAGPTITYSHPDPKFTIQVPAGFVPNEVTQTGGNNWSIRLAKPDEHSGIGTFVSITWWKVDGGYKKLSGVSVDKANRLEEKDIAGGKGKFTYGTKMSSRMVQGELKDAKEFIGASAVDAPGGAITCRVETFDDPPAPAFVRACETLAPQ